MWVSGLYQNTSGGYGWGSITQELSVGSFALPTVTDTKANSVASTSATVNVTVNPKGAATTIHVDYGRTSGYESATPAIAVGSGTSPVTKTVVLSGLTPGIVYHFRAVATTAVGNATTKDRTFTTTTPTISSVVFSGPSGSPTVTINGSGFGTTCSANVLRMQPGAVQKNRRTHNSIATSRPPIAASASVLAYRLWTRRATRPALRARRFGRTRPGCHQQQPGH